MANKQGGNSENRKPPPWPWFRGFKSANATTGCSHSDPPVPLVPLYARARVVGARMREVAYRGVRFSPCNSVSRLDTKLESLVANKLGSLVNFGGPVPKTARQVTHLCAVQHTGLHPVDLKVIVAHC